jgi:alpha-beta hydrolase superfamily lysophospholipase
MTQNLYQDDRILSLSFANGERNVRLWEARLPRALIVAIHGGMSHSGDYATVGAYFREKGFTTISFDLTGHGQKARIDIPHFGVFLDDVERMLSWVRGEYPNLPVFLMGHSMGALIATHMEITGRLNAFDIRGVILSSPYYANAIPVPALVVHLSGLLAKLFPTAKVPMASLTELLTHDTAIIQRHYQDEQAHRRGTEASMRFGRSLLDAQLALGDNLNRWQHPVFAVVAGDDKLADAQISRQMLETIPEAQRELHYFPQNFHENFNETNRDEIFATLWQWIQPHLRWHWKEPHLH